ncbi:MAG TPA: hypothetical protein VFT46_01540 [Holophagaceae bacterium]|nr:hypothetical protein [Holophagaceae bacterium]
MAVPAIKLNLVPEPSLWRERHQVLGWAALALGALVFLGVAGYTAWSYHRASQAGRAAVYADTQTRLAADQERRLLGRLQQIDVDQELPRWRLAERVLSERAAPWSRLTAELEQCLVDGSRLKDIERTRSADQGLLLKVRAEARTHEAEAGLVDRLRQDPVFSQVILERESQQPGGGWEFDLSLPVVPLPPPFVAAGPDKGASVPPSARAAKAKKVAQPAPPAAQAAPARPEPVLKPTIPSAAGRGPLGLRPAPEGARAPRPVLRRPQPGGAR